MLVTSGGILGLSVRGAPVFSQVETATQSPFKVLVTGAHPDDPESGCGGTIRRFVEMGHDVAALYLTRGEAGIEGVPHDEAAEIRTDEALQACEVLGTRPLFFGQIDGDTYVNREAYANMARVIENENPDLVFTHWPIDTHPDHRVTSNLVYNTWTRFRGNEARAFDLYYYEVLTGEQSQNFHPTHFVDITAVAAIKRQATFRHASQKPEEWFSHHEKMDEFRGFQYKPECKFAEGFVHQGFSAVI
jgi:LmbE family N-acetylglucosaminyl deacetylase